MNNASRSSLVTAADLPEDVIIEIITQLNRDDRSRSITNSSNRVAQRAGLITCTHVCRGWRSAGLNCAKLWADIDCARWHIEQIKTFLCRSRDVLLELSMFLPLIQKKKPPFYDRDPGFQGHAGHMEEYKEYEEWLYDDEVPPQVTLCLQKLHRTRSISITVSAHGRQRWISNLINRLYTADAPLLEQFSLDARFCYCSNHYSLFKLEGHLFKNDVPLLRTVRLYGVIIPGDSSLLRNLTSLFVRCVVFSGGQSIKQVLERSPQLTDIVVHMVKCHPAVTHDEDNCLSLPLLATVSVCGPPQFCASLLRGWRIPVSTRLSVLYTQTDEVVAAEATPPFEINKHIRAFVRVDMQQTTMEIQSLNSVDKRAEENPPSFSLTKRKWRFGDWNYFWGLNQLSSKLGRADVPTKRLDLYIHCLLYAHGATPWKALFSRLHHLESFIIHFDTCCPKAMMENSFTHILGQPSDVKELYLPKLRNLVLVIRRPLSERIARLLGRCLESRSKYDPRWRLESLRIECYVNSQQLQEYDDCPWVIFDLQGYLEPHVGRVEISWSKSAALGNSDESSINILLFKTGYMQESQVEWIWWLMDNQE